MRESVVAGDSVGDERLYAGVADVLELFVVGSVHVGFVGVEARRAPTDFPDLVEIGIARLEGSALFERIGSESRGQESRVSGTAQYHYPPRRSVRHGLHGRVANIPALFTGYGERWNGTVRALGRGRDPPGRDLRREPGPAPADRGRPGRHRDPADRHGPQRGLRPDPAHVPVPHQRGLAAAGGGEHVRGAHRADPVAQRQRGRAGGLAPGLPRPAARLRGAGLRARAHPGPGRAAAGPGGQRRLGAWPSSWTTTRPRSRRSSSG